MLRSLHMKLVMLMVLLILSLMTVVGAFLINSVVAFYIQDFYSQMSTVFGDQEIVSDLRTAADGETDGAGALKTVLNAYAGQLGVDTRNRNFYILDGEGTSVLASSNGESGASGLSYTGNLMTAIESGQVGDESNAAADYMDVAIPIQRGGSDYIIYILDNKATVSNLNNQLFLLIMEALLFGLVISVLLSFLLSKTMITPIQRLTEGAMRVAEGDFAHKIEVASRDEIGVLTDTFNDMAGQLQDTIRQVENERNKLNTLFLHMTDGVVAFSRTGEVIHFNPSAEEMLHRPIGTDTTFGELFCGLVSLERVLAVPDYLQEEQTVEERFLQLLMAPFDRDRQGGVLVVIHDVTEQRKNEEMRREFVANVSHELRTPLTNIRSYAETLVDSAGDLPPAMEKKFLGVILNESDRMTHIVQDLLTLSRLDSGRSEMNMARFDFGAAIDSVLRSIELEARRHGHELTHDYHDLPMIMGDRGRIEQVMLNVLGNAVKYTPDGGHIRVTAGTVGERVWMEVADDGIGIPKADRSRIFERFYRVDKARSRESGGTCLGLSIATEIVQRHNGTLSLVDREGPGTTVRLELPIRQSEVGGAQEGGNG